MAQLLLIHGAFQGSWIWRDLRPVLSALGHFSHAPTLTGCGYLHHGPVPSADIATYAADVVNYAAFKEATDLVLVAHSFSGLTCAAALMQAGAPFRRAVFVDAVIPQGRSSFAELAGEGFQKMLAANKTEDGQVNPWPAQVFGVPESAWGWFGSRLRPFPLSAFTAPFPRDFDPAALPISFITCTQTVAPFIRAQAGRAASLGWPVAELASGHCPFVTHPKELAALIDSAIKG